MALNQRYAYYPGCSLETTSEEYNRSMLDAGRTLGLEMVEIPDWICCGASSA
ncbi:MAG: heterodisulfide reductase subunit B, partial [Chloroflexi bacterium]|nr:heterodisulfide reductase subunit B [Chloroflexota bacterium]